MNTLSQDIEKFYELKKTYLSSIENKIDKIMRSDLSIEEKKNQVQLIKQKASCPICNSSKLVLSENPYNLIAKCVNSSCKGNIHVKIPELSFNIETVYGKMKKYRSDLKDKMIKAKMQHMLHIVSEEQLLNNFSELKKEFSEIDKEFTRIDDQLDLLLFDYGKKQELDRLEIEAYEYTKQYKELINKYQTEGNLSYLTEAFELYMDKIEELQNEIRSTKYKINEVLIEGTKENIENIILIQKPHDIEDFEYKLKGTMVKKLFNLEENSEL